MVPPDVCDAKQAVLGPSGGPEVDVTVALVIRGDRSSDAVSNRRSAEKVAHRVRSSIIRILPDP